MFWSSAIARQARLPSDGRETCVAAGLVVSAGLAVALVRRPQPRPDVVVP